MFVCDCCGLCCKHLSSSFLYLDLNRGDGICKFFNEETNLCNIYALRPDKCRIDKMYEIYYKDIITKDIYYQLNYKACLQFKAKNIHI